MVSGIIGPGVDVFLGETGGGTRPDGELPVGWHVGGAGEFAVEILRQFAAGVSRGHWDDERQRGDALLDCELELGA